MNTKTIVDLAWQVDEPTYREDPALSYSTIARYEKGGFSSIPKLFEPIESDSLTFGSIVDTALTEGADKFNEKFLVTDVTPPTGIADIIKALASSHKDAFSFDDVSDDEVLQAAAEWNPRLKPETKLNKIREEGSDYFMVLLNSEGKTLVDTKTYNDAQEVIRTLRYYPLTSKYFGNDTPSIKKYYQTKFKTELDGVEVRCMFDLLIVNYEQKWIMPVDLKTTGMPEYDFFRRYLEFRYDIQARLYWRILNQIISQDEYFKDFKLYKFQFVCVNRHSKTPLVWYANDCNKEGELTYTTKYNRTIILRDPIVIAKELSNYLSNETKVPKGIELAKPNNIEEWIKNN